MICPNCGKKATKKRELYRYLESGLDNVYLETDVFKCKCGEAIADIPNIHALHELIAAGLVKRSSQLIGSEIRYLRKQMHLKAVELAELLSVNKVTVSRWENGSENIGATNDKLIRFLYTQMFQEKCNTVVQLLDGIKGIKPNAKRIKIIIPKKQIKKAVCHI